VLFLISTSHPDPAGRLKAVGAAAGAKVLNKIGCICEKKVEYGGGGG